ncbi:MAG: PocR ligand-binding domain-containing protein [Clostridia bacterium]|nr:PocR ligand-binding domain-containing protein [Clostridia bacterium]
MLSQNEFTRLARLLHNLHLCTGIKCALMDEEGREVYTSSDRTPFCSSVMRECGMDKCLACDRENIECVLKTHQPRRYLCHAGLYEAAMPVLENGRVAAIILFGQMLDDSPREEQWERVRRLCAWHTDPEGLHQAFLHLRRISSEQMAACMEIARACVSEVRLHGLNAIDPRDDALRLKLYIDAHYAEALTTDILAEALHVGKTKLYEVCHRRFRLTPMQMVTRARIEAAQELLTATNESIKSISQSVGFTDQNYFAKVFRKETGEAPTAYRSRGMKE